MSKLLTERSSKPGKTAASKGHGALKSAARAAVSPFKLEALEERQLFAWGAFPTLIGQDKLVANYPNLRGQGESVVLIDSGIDYKHPALGGGFGAGFKIAGGYDFVDKDADPYVGDSNVHATGIAGIIAANQYTFQGNTFRGLAPDVKVYVLRQSGSQQAKQALQWVINNKSALNIVAVNLTDFFTDQFNPYIYQNELNTLGSMGVFVASPTGNLGPSSPVTLPGASPSVYTTCAIDLTGAVTSFSQRDFVVDLVAPGERVTIPYYDYAAGKSIYTDYAQGTSWSTAHLTGLALLIRQINPSWTPAQVMGIIRDAGKETYDPDTGLTFPRIDVYKAVQLAYDRLNNTGVPQPFGADPALLGNVIELENYDKGGQGFAYSDTDYKNVTSIYRGNGVDIERTSDGGSDGYTISYTKAGEWMNYTLDAGTGGTYTIDVRAAAAASGGKFHIEIDGVDKTGQLSVVNTGSYSTYANVTKTGVVIGAGVHRVRVVFDANTSAGFVGNFNWMKFTKTAGGGGGGAANTPFTGIAYNLPGTLQVENFDNGGQDIAYNDSTSANLGGAYRSSGVDIEPTSDTGGGYDIGYTVVGEWLKYTVNVTAGGTYTLGFRVAAATAGAKFHLEVDGDDVTGALTMPSTGGYQTWQTLVKSGVVLSSGQHVLRLVFDAANANGSIGNINWISFDNASAPTTPAAPTGLVATVQSATKVGLSWVDNASNESNYFVERKTGNGSWQVLTPAGLGADTTSYVDTTASASTSYSYRVRASNSFGDSNYSNEDSTTTPAAPKPTPFSGAPFTIGQTIQAEDYDAGGQGVAYNDVDSANRGGKYRLNDGVDIETTSDTGDGFNIGFTSAGEWLNYTVSVTTAGPINFSARIASLNGGASFHVEIDGVNVSGAVAVNSTGGYQSWQTLARALGTLSVGEHAMKIVVDAGGMNLNWFKLTAGGVVQPPAAPSSLSAVVNGSTSVTLNWQDNSSTEDTFSIERKIGSNGGWSVVGSANGSNGSTGTYTDNSVISGNTYYYRVSALIGSTGSSPSNEASAPVPLPQGSPYKGTPFVLGQTIQAEDFDNGGEGVGYHDTSSANYGGAYRSTAVDIEASSDTGGGYDIGWTAAGEYLNYSFTLDSATAVTFSARVASSPGGGIFRVLIDGVDSSGQINVGATGGWQAWQTLTRTLGTLSSGAHTMQILFDAGNVNVNWFRLDSSAPATPPAAPTNLTAQAGSPTSVALAWDDNSNNEASFTVERRTGTTGAWSVVGQASANASGTATYTDNKAGGNNLYYYRVTATNSGGPSAPTNLATATTPTPASTPFGGTPFSTGGTIQAEDFNNGGEGVAYHDTDAAANGSAPNYRPGEGVDIETTSDTGGGYNVAYVKAGEVLTYTITIDADGIYSFDARVAAAGNGGSIHAEIDGQNVTGSIALGNTGGWQNWQTRTVNGIALTAGQHILSVVADTNGQYGYTGNLNWFKVS